MKRNIMTFESKGLEDAITEAAEKKQVSKSEIIRACIKKALKIKSKELV